MSEPHRVAVFDMDGLLINTEHLYDDAIGELLDQRGHVFTRDCKLAMMGRPAPAALAILVNTYDLEETHEALIHEIEERLMARMEAGLRTLPGAETLLDFLEERKVPMSVATSSRRRFAEHALGRVGLLERFRFLVCGDEIARGKPAPDIYLESARRHAVAPTAMIVFEDSVTGTTAALASGAFTVTVPGEHSRDATFPEVPLRVDRLDDPRVLSRFLSR